MKINLGFLRRLLRERNAAAKRGIQLKDAWQELLEIAGPDTYVTFSHLNKVGINPTSDFKTPVGIYVYVLDEEFVNEMKSGKMTFAVERPYMHVLTAADPSSTLILQKVSLGDAVDLANRVRTAVKRSQVSEEKFIEMTNGAENDSPGGRFWYFSMRSSHDPGLKAKAKHTFAWNKLLRRIGLSGIVDLGDGIIHRLEPKQAVFFSAASVQHVATILNPFRKEIIRKCKKEINLDMQMYDAIKAAYQDGILRKDKKKLKEVITSVSEDPRFTFDIMSVLYDFENSANAKEFSRIESPKVWEFLETGKNLPDHDDE